MAFRAVLLASVIGSLAGLMSAREQAPVATPPGPPPTARQAFNQTCLTCHGNPDVPRAADPTILRRMTPEGVYAALTTGPMQAHAEGLNDALRRGIAEYLSDRKLGATDSGAVTAMPNRCGVGVKPAPSAVTGVWNGWGADLSNTRSQPMTRAGLGAAAVPRLQLAWAFALPSATAVYGQPSVVDGRVYVGGDSGYVYALDARSGCAYWGFQAQAGVRGAVTIASAGRAGVAAFFGDLKGNVYAVSAVDGRLLWTVRADDHSLTRIVAAPVWYRDRLYVSVASAEEGASTSPRYPCCTFRGSVLALRVDTGEVVWKTSMIADAPGPTRVSSAGTQMFGPSGAGVWGAPTIDTRLGALYVGTGNNYSRPTTAMADAVVALDLATGKVRWSRQFVADDVWIPGCAPGGAPVGNCPENVGPDYDFGASPILKTLPTGRRVLIAVAKSGVVYAVDPDRNGVDVWRTPTQPKPAGPEGEMVWGAAADAARVYVGLTSGGVAAYRLSNGTPVWTTTIAPSEPSRRAGHSGAVTVTPGVVFSGGWDGVVRALSASTGQIMWQFDTFRAFDTVNQAPGRGGSMGAAGPTVAGGMVFVGSGYIGVRNGTPGNVLLAFRPGDR
jgi:polyvinyl alcohol dehydrogenase (cytochrome)